MGSDMIALHWLSVWHDSFRTVSHLSSTGSLATVVAWYS
jgi:hypothetical protein